MRRTLTVLVASAALLVPATAASAATVTTVDKLNASCNSGQQRGPSGFGFNGGGNVDVGTLSVESGCGNAAPPPPPPPPVNN